MNNLVKQITLACEGTQEQIIERVERFCKVNNLTYKNLVIHDRFVTFDGWSKISYENLVNKLIAERYTIQDELAIHRKHSKGVNEAEFDEYDKFAEQCKLDAKAFIEERESVVNA